jgi:hypothetical protein
MNLNDFKESLNQEAPPSGISIPLQALWQEARGDWRQAHDLLQDEESQAASWVHAYLHRKEGDRANAAYWYSRARQPVSEQSLEAEWEAIAGALLADQIG